MQSDFLTCDIIAACLSAACLPFDNQEPYEVGLVGRAAKKRSPLLDPVTWHHDLKNIPARYLCVLDRVFSIRSEDHIDSVTPDSFMYAMSQC